MKLFTTVNDNLKRSLVGLALIGSAAVQAQVLVNEDFNTASGSTPPANWLNEDTGGSDTLQIWRFNNPGNRVFTGGNPGFSGQFAIIDSDINGDFSNQNCNLVTPSFDASDITFTYRIEFDDNWEECCEAVGQVQVFNGATWVTVFTEPVTGDADGDEDMAIHRGIDITSATGGFNAAKVRFHYEGDYDYWWAVDNVKITKNNCLAPTVSFSIAPDCANNQYSVNANITNMGSATSLSLNDGLITYGTPITTAGTYVAGPFTSNTNQMITLVHNDAICNITQNLSFNCALPNDLCAFAINIPVGSGVAATAVTSTTVGATIENNMAAPSCGDELANDIWFKVTVPASGNVTIQSAALSSSQGQDVVMEAYSGTCGSLAYINCNDDGNPDIFPSNAHARIALTGQTAGATIYVRITPYGNTEYGPVAMTAWDPVAPTVAASGTCGVSQAVTIDGANGNLYRWVPVLDVTGKLVAEIHPRGNALGALNCNLYTNASGMVRQANGIYYLDRNITIIPANQPNNGNNVDVRIYALASELTALTAMDPAVTSFANLNISKSQEACQPAVNAATAQIAQSGNQAFTDGAGTNAGYVQFSTTSFSSFYLRGGTTPLPIVLKSISAKNAGAINQVDWVTLSELSTDRFELERSADGRTFALLAKIATTGKPSSYSYMDYKPFAGDNYYRLKLISKDGRPAYSTTVKATLETGTGYDLYAYPNPVIKSVTIKVSGSENGKLFITDISGKVVSERVMKGSVSEIDCSKMDSGVYFIRYTDGNFSKTIKINKQ